MIFALDDLRKRGRFFDYGCPMCLQDSESPYYLLFALRLEVSGMQNLFEPEISFCTITGVQSSLTMQASGFIGWISDDSVD